MARKRDRKTLHVGSWMLGYGHHCGPEAVEISNRDNKNRKEAELGKRKRAHEKSKKFDKEVNRVRTESPPEERKTPEDLPVEALKVVVKWCHRPGDKIIIMKNYELRARWVEIKGQSEYDPTWIAPGGDIYSTKRRHKSTKTATSKAKKKHPKDDASPSVSCSGPTPYTSKQGHKKPASNGTDN
jgi:hypothetical protein